jgi:hypothetical protein
MKQILSFISLLAWLSGYSQSVDISFDQNKLDINRSIDKEATDKIKININSKAFPPLTKLKLVENTAKNSLPGNAYEIDGAREINLSTYIKSEWTLDIKIKPDPKGDQKETGQLFLKLEIVTESNEKINLTSDRELEINIHPVTNPKTNKGFSFFGRDIDKTNVTRKELTQYTDFLGFGNDRPNGILQQRFLFKWPLNKHYHQLGNAQFAFFRSIILPNILFNRIDKAKSDSSVLYPVKYVIRSRDSAGTITRDTALSPSVGTFDIMRYASLKIESKLVLASLKIDNTRIYFDIQGGILRNRIVDTLSKRKPDSTFQERFIYTHYYGFEIYVKSLLDDKDLNIELEAGYNRYIVKDNYFKQYDMYQMDNDGRRSLGLPIGKTFKRMSAPIWFGSITLRKDWGKEDNADKKNSAFFRMAYSFQNDAYNKPVPNRPKEYTREKLYNHYLQLQLGLSLSLDKIFSN